MPCTRRDPELMDRYLLARLSQAERESFERHLFECPECAEELEALETIQATLRRVSVDPDARVQWRSRWLVAAIAAAACVAAVAFGLWLVASRPQTVARGLPPPESPPLPAPAVPRTAPSVSSDLLALAEIRPPAYDPTVLRGGADAAESDFRKAMEAYRRGDHAAAIPALRSAAQSAPGDPRPAFYLGACQLLIGDIDRGVITLEGVVALGHTPYLEESHVLLAKAHLWRGERERARDELRSALALQGDFEGEARRLLQALDEGTSRP